MAIFTINQDSHAPAGLGMTKLFPIQRFTVYGNSMFPTLKPGQDVLVLCWPRLNRGWFFKLKVGDIVVIKRAGKDIIKRIHLYHGRSISVLGDNPKESTDSRHFGWIDRGDILGKIILVLQF